MSTPDFQNIFFDSFNTFKVFDDLSVIIANEKPPGAPKSVWQILNHLVSWQQQQLSLLNGETPLQNIIETETWIGKPVNEQSFIDSIVSTFNDQIKEIKHITSALTPNTPSLQLKLKCVQDLTGHLSFHLGEIILIRRQLKNYPMPDEMKAFLLV
ncbi:DinB family protein [Mucilaginibacter sp.]|uniref:DinB family protein n=1 Tax=Mucilaginibacter sp. TaxID=1882438 RepID=UPI002606EB12|nr:DinB family protein [Mucilaginibacter sp.]MDB4923775.1 hypothetical protein [Mucilaginibacter sp.]